MINNDTNRSCGIADDSANKKKWLSAGSSYFFSRKRMKNEWGSVAELTPLWNPSRRIFQKKKEIAGVYCGWRVISQMLNREGMGTRLSSEKKFSRSRSRVRKRVEEKQPTTSKKEFDCIRRESSALRLASNLLYTFAYSRGPYVTCWTLPSCSK
jgi:hypothetical protein